MVPTPTSFFLRGLFARLALCTFVLLFYGQSNSSQSRCKIISVKEEGERERESGRAIQGWGIGASEIGGSVWSSNGMLGVLLPPPPPRSVGCAVLVRCSAPCFGKKGSSMFVCNRINKIVPI